MVRFRDLVELIRAPAALSVPGDALAGAAAAGTLGARTAGLCAASGLVRGCDTVVAEADRVGVRLGFKPEPGMLDIGHCQCIEPDPVARCVVRAGPYLVNVQIDDMRRGVHEHLEFGTGEVDFPPVLGALTAAGVRALVEPAFWLGQPRTNTGSFTDYFDSLVGWEPFRASQFGIRHHCAIALNPKEANDPRCRRVLDLLPRYLAKDGVVAVGEVGYDSMTPDEDEVFAAQLALAVEYELPALVHTPHRDKRRGTERTLDVVKESGIEPGRVIVDHLNEVTVDLVAGSGCWMGFSIYPDTKMSPTRMVAILREYGPDRILVNSAADWGRSDPLLTLRTGEAMLDAGFTADDADRVLWRNPVEFFGQSGRLDLSAVDDVGPAFAGNSILRGGG